MNQTENKPRLSRDFTENKGSKLWFTFFILRHALDMLCQNYLMVYANTGLSNHLLMIRSNWVYSRADERILREQNFSIFLLMYSTSKQLQNIFLLWSFFLSVLLFTAILFESKIFHLSSFKVQFKSDILSSNKGSVQKWHFNFATITFSST